MKCQVCHAMRAAAGRCPQCGYDPALPGAGDSAAILRAREAFKAKTLAYDPDSRVTLFDKLKPWIGVALGFVIFLFWLRACSTMGWSLF